MIVTEVRRLDALVKDFLDFARQQRLDVRTIALPLFLQQVVDLWQPVAAARDIALTLDVAPELTEAGGDADKLRRVLDNLLKNAGGGRRPRSWSRRVASSAGPTSASASR